MKTNFDTKFILPIIRLKAVCKGVAIFTLLLALNTNFALCNAVVLSENQIVSAEELKSAAVSAKKGVSRVATVAKSAATTKVAQTKKTLASYFDVVVKGGTSATREKNLLLGILKRLPSSHAETPNTVILRYDDPGIVRGLGGAKTIILRTIDVTQDEFMSVFVHELGHNVDLGLLSGASKQETAYYDGDTPIYSDDKSLDFYQICWETTEIENNACDNLDFVSGYARSNSFEDFAETYMYYVLHGNEFRKRAATNDKMAEKYAFMKEIFEGKEYYTGNLANLKLPVPWDATLLDLGQKLVSIRWS